MQDEKPKTTMTDGSPVTADHRELKENGQQKGYVVLSEEERAKGYCRPVRRSYTHVGPPPPLFPLRDLTPAEQAEYAAEGYVKYEEYPESEAPVAGKFWKRSELEYRGCGVTTTMSQAIAETYARDPKFYGGTYCCGCHTHLPVNQFVWSGTDERVGS